MNQRANALADRLEQEARALLTFASTLTDAQWQTPIFEDHAVRHSYHHLARIQKTLRP